MTKEHFHVRPNDSGTGWSVDHYDGRGAWVATSSGNRSMTKPDAQQKASQLRRLSVSAPVNESLVNRCQHQLAAGVQCRHRVTAPQAFCGQHRGLNGVW